MSVKLGIAPIAWSNDDMPELGGDTPLEQCLLEASQAGFIGIESGGKFPKKSEELIPKLNEFKLNLCSGWYGANLRKNTVGRIAKRLNELVLLSQPYIKDSSLTVEDLVKQVAAKIGENIKVRRFTRYTLGEGIEKNQMDFAEEVASMQTN